MENSEKKYNERVTNKTTFRGFFLYFLNECIDWNGIIESLNSKLHSMILCPSIRDLIRELQEDLQKINLAFMDPENILQKFIDLNLTESEFRSELSNRVIQKSGVPNEVADFKEICLQDFSWKTDKTSLVKNIAIKNIAITKHRD